MPPRGHLFESIAKALGRSSPDQTPPPGESRPAGELLSAERLDEEAAILAARFTVDRHPGRARAIAFRRFDRSAKSLGRAYRTFLSAAHRGEFLTSAGEWLLDNYPIVATAARDVRRGVPRG
jgi:hypothetical protein